MLRIFAIGLTLCVSVYFAEAQTKRFTKDVNADGWSTPALKDLKVREETPVVHAGISVIRTAYDLGEDGPSISIPGNKFCEFRSLRSYRFKDQVFAIEGYCVIFSVQTTRSKRYTVSSKTYYGAMTVYTFVDEDQNGDFESRFNSSGYLDFTPPGGIRP